MASINKYRHIWQYCRRMYKSKARIHKPIRAHKFMLCLHYMYINKFPNKKNMLIYAHKKTGIIYATRKIAVHKRKKK